MDTDEWKSRFIVYSESFVKTVKTCSLESFSVSKTFSLLACAGVGKTKTKLEYLKMVCIQNSLRITIRWRPLDFIG